MTDLQHGILQWLALIVSCGVGVMVGYFSYRWQESRLSKTMMLRDVERLAAADARIPRAAVIDVHGG